MTDMRIRAVEEALSWEHTPYHHRACIKGVGVDCAMFVVAVFTSLGLVPVMEIPEYSMDWNLHMGSPIMRDLLERYADRVETPLPGDVVAYVFGRQISHLAIVLDWPNSVIHSLVRAGKVTRTIGNQGEFDGHRIFGFYRVRGLE